MKGPLENKKLFNDIYGCAFKIHTYGAFPNLIRECDEVSHLPYTFGQLKFKVVLNLRDTKTVPSVPPNTAL
jgi:hypothetical protein